MFTGALFTIAKTWKQPKYSLTDGGIKKIYIHGHTHTHICTHAHTYIHKMKYYSIIKKNEIMSFAATWMDLEIIILSEVSQTKTNII